MYKRLLLLMGIFLLLGTQNSNAQNIDLFSEANGSQSPDIITGTFKSTRIMNGQSIENVGAGLLDFRILDFEIEIIFNHLRNIRKYKFQY